MGLLARMVSICLTVGTDRLFSSVVYHSAFPHQHLGIWGLFFHFSLSNKYAMVSHCGFNLHFPDDQ